MTLKKMSVAANDIVLNNLVMREKTFKTIPYQLCSVLLNLQFYPTQPGKTPLCIFKSSSRLLYTPMPILLFLIFWNFLFFSFFLSNLREFSYDLTCAGAHHHVCCRLSYPAQPQLFRHGKICSVPDVCVTYLSLREATVFRSAPQQDISCRHISATL